MSRVNTLLAIFMVVFFLSYAQEITINTMEGEPVIITSKNLSEPYQKRTWKFFKTGSVCDQKCVCKSLVKDYLLSYRYTQIYEESEVPQLTWLNIPLPRIKTDDYPEEKFKGLGEFQRINRFPGLVKEINAKDGIARNLQRMQAEYDKELFHVHPETYILPEDYDKLQEITDTTSRWLYKPKYGGAGAGIELYKNVKDIPNNSDYIVQKYIENPMLLNGYKFTIRLYAVITSYNPLRFYLNKKGIIKMTTEKFESDLENFSNTDSKKHVINQADYKHNPEENKMYEDPNVDNVGNRWSLRAFREYCVNNNIDYTALWEQMQEVLLKKLIAVEPIVTQRMVSLNVSSNCCFQLMGVDVDIDSNYKVWILESNVNPTLGSRAAFDFRDRKKTLTDFFQLTGIYPGFEEFEENLKNISVAEVSPFLKQNDFSEFGEITEKELRELALIEYEDKYKGDFLRVFPKSSDVDTWMKYLDHSIFGRSLKLAAKYVKLRKL